MAENSPVKQVTETYSDGTNWCRQWPDGWLEQGGLSQHSTCGSWLTLSLLRPCSDMNYTLYGSVHDSATTGTYEVKIMAVSGNQFKWAYTYRVTGMGTAPYTCHWYTAGMSTLP